MPWQIVTLEEMDVMLARWRWRNGLRQGYVTLSERGLALLKHSEGFRPEAYPDGNGFSIGYGHHSAVVKAGDRVTEQDAEDLLQSDVAVVEAAIRKYVKVPLNQNQYDALVNFVYNVGIGHFEMSTLLRKLNAWDYEAAATEMMRWIKANGEDSPGLMARRELEMRLFERELLA